MKNWLDILIIVLGVLAIWKGYVRGFLREALEIVGIVVAFIAAICYSPQVAIFFTNIWNIPPNISTVLSYAVILTGVAIVVQIIIYFTSSFTSDGVLGILDSSVGGFFSLIKLGLVLIIVLNLVVIGPLQFFKNPVLESQVANYLLNITPELYDFMIDNFPENWSEQLELYREQFLAPNENEPVRRI
ncbi:MAG: CvpA family protein [Firmicutes bacterium]|nr:CvpA family protein [Bacillota bacterium]MDD4694245.1 CvpA family protein [Bacillota bacterium]